MFLVVGGYSHHFGTIGAVIEHSIELPDSRADRPTTPLDRPTPNDHNVAVEDDLTPRQRPLVEPPILFAHRGARAHAPENTLAAFRLAVEMGATGLESDVWLTRDGVAVLDHDGVIGRLRRRRIAETDVDDLPDHIPTLAQFYDEGGDRLPLSLDIKDPAAFDAVIDVAVGAGALNLLWVVHEEPEVLAEWRSKHSEVRLVNSVFLSTMKSGPERWAATLRSSGITGINMHGSEWTGGLSALFHRFGLTAFGWDAQHTHQIQRLLHIGLDGVFSDHVDRLCEAAAGPSEPAHP